jgi:hypothetical protein
MVPSSSFGRRHLVREPANFLTFLSSIRIRSSRRGEANVEKISTMLKATRNCLLEFCAAWLRHSFAIALGDATILNDVKIRAYLGD